MNREVHVRFWESPEVKVLRATRPRSGARWSSSRGSRPIDPTTPDIPYRACSVMRRPTFSSSSYQREDHHLRSVSTMTVLGLALASSSAVSQQQSLKEQLVGSWTYASADTVRPDGSRVVTGLVIELSEHDDARWAQSVAGSARVT